VAGAVLAFLALTTVQAVGINPYLPPDELYHVGYALIVRDGRLPELTTQVPQDEVPLRVPDHGNRRIYTANHQHGVPHAWPLLVPAAPDRQAGGAPRRPDRRRLRTSASTPSSTRSRPKVNSSSIPGDWLSSSNAPEAITWWSAGNRSGSVSLARMRP
jgi:hypothetical protein